MPPPAPRSTPAPPPRTKTPLAPDAPAYASSLPAGPSPPCGRVGAARAQTGAHGPSPCGGQAAREEGACGCPPRPGDRRQGSPQRAFGPHHCPWGPPGGREGSPQSDLSAQRIEAKRTHPLGRRLGHGRRPGFQRAVSGPGPWGATAVLGEGGGGAGAPHLGFQLPLRVQSASTRRWVPNLGPSTPRHSDQGQFEAEGPEASRHAGCPEEVADLSVRRPPLSSPGLELPTESH